MRNEFPIPIFSFPYATYGVVRCNGIPDVLGDCHSAPPSGRYGTGIPPERAA
jgi:hypothetical protein